MGAVDLDLQSVDEFDLLVACLRGEAEGEPFMGKLAIACVIRNRVKDKRWPDTYRGVMLQPYQFSCFLPQYFRPQTLKHDWDKSYWKECNFAAFGVYHDWVRDITGGANHYHAFGVHPKWADDMERADINIAGHHIFYKG